MHSFQAVLAAYGQPLAPDEKARAGLEITLSGSRIDFAALTVAQQTDVLRRVVHCRRSMDELASRNPFLRTAIVSLEDDACCAAIEQNAAIVRRRYSVNEAGEHLAELHRRLLASPRSRVWSPSPRRRYTERLPRRQPFSPGVPMKSREEHLAMIRRMSRPMDPIPTGVAAILKPLRQVEAILFDVYGTLLISGSGDIGSGDRSQHASAFGQAIGDAHLTLLAEGAVGVECLRETMLEQHRRGRAAGVEWPEVDLLEVWRATLGELHRRKQIRGDVAAVDVPTLSLRYELLTNPVWPMPEAAECLMELARRGLRLGVISNAQWFTPLLFPALLGGELDAIGVARELQVFSWQLGCASPARSCFGVRRTS